VSHTAVLLPQLLAAGLAAGAVGLAVPRSADVRRLRDRAGLLASAPPGSHPFSPQADVGTDDLVGRHRGLVSLLAGAAPVLLLGGVAGVVVGVVVLVVVFRMLGSREPAHERRRRELVDRGLPQVVDLLAVTLASGASPSAALSAVAAAVEGPVAAELRRAEHSLRLGRDPARVWREVSGRPGLAGLGRAMARAVETGASVSEALHRLAEDLHASARLEAESRARSVGVRAAAPLGLCLLPSFVLVGVVPLVASTVTALLAP
jgi:Flp pilus assembly protein TadB